MQDTITYLKLILRHRAAQYIVYTTGFLGIALIILIKSGQWTSDSVPNILFHIPIIFSALRIFVLFLIEYKISTWKQMLSYPHPYALLGGTMVLYSVLFTLLQQEVQAQWLSKYGFGVLIIAIIIGVFHMRKHTNS